MSSYENKKKLLFDCLNNAEQCIKGTSLEQSELNRNESADSDGHKRIAKRFHGKESIFKRPAAPIGKCLRPRHVPDYQANPHKWKKYSLDDADISDRTNASAAFAFLAEMERRKDSDDNPDDASAMDTDGNESSRGKILFKRQSNQRPREGWQRPSFNKSVSVRRQIECTDTASNESETSEKPMLKGSKVVMPEYVIGQKVASNKTKKSKLSSSSGSSTQTGDTKDTGKQQNRKPLLQHLFDEDQDQDDDDNDVDKMDDN